MIIWMEINRATYQSLISILTSRDSTVSKVTGYGLDDAVSIPIRGRDFSLFQWVAQTFCPRTKLTEHADLLIPPGAEFRMSAAIASVSIRLPFGVLIQHSSHCNRIVWHWPKVHLGGLHSNSRKRIRGQCQNSRNSQFEIATRTCTSCANGTTATLLIRFREVMCSNPCGELPHRQIPRCTTQ
jgi:hypothetical protein